jgi:hypothetical protein
MCVTSLSYVVDEHEETRDGAGIVKIRNVVYQEVAQAVNLGHRALIALLISGQRRSNVRFIGPVELFVHQLAVVRADYGFGLFAEPVEKRLIRKAGDQIGIPIADGARHCVEDPLDE